MDKHHIGPANPAAVSGQFAVFGFSGQPIDS